MPVATCTPTFPHRPPVKRRDDILPFCPQGILQQEISSKKNYDTLLLDADDTLLDFSRTEKNALDLTFSRYGLKLTDEIRDIYHTVNRGLWAAFERGEISKETVTSTRFSRLFAETGYAVDGIAFARDYQLALGEGYYLIDGARELCEKLAGKYRLYCVTNGVAATQHSRLAGSGLNEYFSGIFVSETIGHQKPSRTTSGRFSTPSDAFPRKKP